MALPPTFSARTRGSTVLRAPRQTADIGIAPAVSLLGRRAEAAEQTVQDAQDYERNTNYRIAEREAERNRMLAGLDTAARFSGEQVAISEDVAAMEREPAPGGQGHKEAVRELLSKRRTEFVSALPDDEEARARAELEWDTYAARVMVRADGFEATERVKKQGNDYDTLQQNAHTLLYNTPTPEQFGAWRAQRDGLIDMMELGADDKAALRQQDDGAAFSSLLAGLIDSGQYNQAEALRKDERFAGTIDYKASQRFKSLAQNAAAVEARENEMRQEVARDELRKQIDGVKALLREGATDVSSIDVGALVKQAQDLGLDPAEVVEVQSMSIGVQVNQRFSDVGKLETGIREMERLQQAGKLDEAGQIQLRYMRERLTAIAETQGEQYKGEWDKGGGSRLQVVRQLYDMPLDRRQRTVQALGGSDTAVRAMRLQRGPAFLAITGAEARQADKDLVPETKTDRERYRKTFETVTAGALADVPVAERQGLMDLALDLYAGTLQRQNKRGWQEDVFQQSVQMVLGRSNGRGGVATWHGRGFLLPEWLSAGEYGREAKNFDFAGAIEPADIVRRKYTPVAVDDGSGDAVYQFRDSSGAWLGKKGGGIYRARIPRPKR